MHRPNTVQAARPQRGASAFPSPSEELPPDSRASQQGHVRLQPLAPAQRPLRVTPAVPGAGGARLGAFAQRERGGGRGWGTGGARQRTSWALGVPGPVACLAPRSARPHGSSRSCARAWGRAAAESPRNSRNERERRGRKQRRGSSAGPAGGTRHGCPTIHTQGPPGTRQG